MYYHWVPYLQCNIQTVEAISASGFEGLLHGLDENKRGIVLRNPEGLKEVFEAGKFLVMG